MRSARSSRTLLAAAFSILISLVLATQALAVTWSAPRAMTGTTPSHMTASAIAATGATSAIVAFTQQTVGYPRILTRRTTDSGGTWMPAVVMSSGLEGPQDARDASIASAGSNVDLVWLYGGSEFGCSEGGCQVAYRRSTDGGVHWSAIQLFTAYIAPPGGAISPRVARRGDNVIVTWTNLGSGAIRVRTSSTGGATFRPAITVATSTNQPYQSTARNAWADVAIGTTMSYLIYAPSDGRVAIRRSGDGGVIWEPAVTLATNANTVDQTTIAATGGIVVAGWVAMEFVPEDDSWSVYKRSTDSGATWSGVRQLSPRTGPRSWAMTIDYRSGTWLGTFERCVTADCSAGADRAVYLRTSADGATWGATSRVSQVGPEEAFPGGATTAGRLLVAYTTHATSGDPPTAWVRAGTP
jgi:hypothetical protein